MWLPVPNRTPCLPLYPFALQAICSLIYAGERIATDLAEIAAVAKQLVGKYRWAGWAATPFVGASRRPFHSWCSAAACLTRKATVGAPLPDLCYCHIQLSLPPQRRVQGERLPARGGVRPDLPQVAGELTE